MFLFLTLEFTKWCPIQTFSHFRIIHNVADVLMAPQETQGLQEIQEYQASTALQDSRELEGSLVRLEHPRLLGSSAASNWKQC